MILYLYHFFQRGLQPFRTLSDLPAEEGERVHLTLQAEHNAFARRNAAGDYMRNRRIVEDRMRRTFQRRGGRIQRENPYYMMLAADEPEEGRSWYPQAEVIRIPVEEFDPAELSFTYGDSFPVFKPIFPEEADYPLYRYNEIQEVIRRRGMPPKRTAEMSWLEPTYIEAQVWSDAVVEKYRAMWHAAR